MTDVLNMAKNSQKNKSEAVFGILQGREGSHLDWIEKDLALTVRALHVPIGKYVDRLQ